MEDGDLAAESLREQLLADSVEGKSTGEGSILAALGSLKHRNYRLLWTGNTICPR